MTRHFWALIESPFQTFAAWVDEEGRPRSAIGHFLEPLPGFVAGELLGHQTQVNLGFLHAIDPRLISCVDLAARSGFDRFALCKAR